MNLEKPLSDFLAFVGTFKNRLKIFSWMFFRQLQKSLVIASQKKEILGLTSELGNESLDKITEKWQSSIANRKQLVLIRELI